MWRNCILFWCSVPLSGHVAMLSTNRQVRDLPVDFHSFRYTHVCQCGINYVDHNRIFISDLIFKWRVLVPKAIHNVFDDLGIAGRVMALPQLGIRKEHLDQSNLVLALSGFVHKERLCPISNPSDQEYPNQAPIRTSDEATGQRSLYSCHIHLIKGLQDEWESDGGGECVTGSTSIWHRGTKLNVEMCWFSIKIAWLEEALHEKETFQMQRSGPVEDYQ